ncbi:MAG TPA: S1C family serine protease [Treponemataceae bacterium]|nr:S1C family serine protease [Treponemataceae bacterium]
MNKICSVLLCILLLHSCTSKSVHEYTPLNYTELDARINEIEDIIKVRDTEPVKSLWRSYLLASTKNSFDDDSEKVFAECEDSIISFLQKSIDDKDYVTASKYFSSLKSVESKKIESYASWFSHDNYYDNVNVNVNDNDKEIKADEVTSQVEQLSEVKVSDFLSGTVTVWVDRGIKVEKGMGYADRVIGSGFFIDDKGHFVTNYHVIESEVDASYEGYSRVYVKLYKDSATRIPAKVIGYDKALDLALLKTEAIPPYVFSLGSSADLDVGDAIYAIGSPLGLENTITSGIVSAKDRYLFSIAQVMQIDAAVNSGNSGGPIIDKNGNVKAVVFAGIMEYEGLNFAIPVEYLKTLLPALYMGKVEHSWTGFYGITKKEFPSSQKGSGVEVLYIMSGSSAQRSSLSIGDVITHINDISIEGVEHLQRAMLGIPQDSIIQCKGINSAGEAFVKALYTEVRPENPLYDVYQREPLARSFLPIFGMDLTPSSTLNKNVYTINSIIQGSIADENGFSVLDPVEVKRNKLLEENQILYAELFTRKRSNAYFEVNIAIAAPLDSPFIF